MKLKFLLILLTVTGCAFVGASHAAAPVNVTIDPRQAPGPAIPKNFIGLSFGMKVVSPYDDGTRFFSPANTQLITLFQNLGLTHLRLGGTTVESPTTTPIPNTEDIDNLFAFAKAAGVGKVIYSLRLLEADPKLNYPATNAKIAKYIWTHYRDQLDSFSIGNEPDLQRVFKQDHTIRNWETYFARWKLFASAISQAVPEARFSGPNVAGNFKWITSFAGDLKNSGSLSAINLHFYVGAAGKDVSPQDGIKRILSRDWHKANQDFFDKAVKPVRNMGMPYRFAEANDHYSGGVPGASETFAGALWALDFLHWWAARGALSVDFHNTQWKVNNVITTDNKGGLLIHPKGYGLRAFYMGSHGHVETAKIINPRNVNLACYAVRGEREHFVTLINKEHGANASAANVIITIPGSEQPAATLFLVSKTGEAGATDGVTLGGDNITSTHPWNGEWKPLAPKTRGQYELSVPATSAVVVKIPIKKQ